MDLQVKLAWSGNLRAYSNQVNSAAARGARNAVEIITTRAKLALRDDIRRAGLGDRLANTWRSRTYPAGGKASLSPAGFVYSKAPLIVTAFSNDTSIVSRNGVWLAIPTENTPRRGRRRATPFEVEVIFNQDLIVFKGRGGQLLAFVDVVKSKNGKKFRRATKTRTGRGRKPELVLMFVFVRQVHLRKRLNYPQIVAALDREWPHVMASAINAELESV